MMVLAVFASVIVDMPTTGNSTNDVESQWQELRGLDEDVLGTLPHLLPFEKGAGHNAAESVFTLAFAQDTKNVKHYVDSMWQPGVGWDLSYRNPFNSNTRDWTTLAGEGGEPVWDATSAQTLIDGKWNWAMTLPTLSVSDGVTDTDTITAHIYHSKLVTQPGDWLQAQVSVKDKGTGMKLAYPGETIFSVTKGGISLDAYLTPKGTNTPRMNFSGPISNAPYPTAIDLHICLPSGSVSLNASRLQGPSRPTLDFDLPSGWAWSQVPFQPPSGAGPLLFDLVRNGTLDNGHLAAHLVLRAGALLQPGQCSVLDFALKYASLPAVPILWSPLTIHFANGLLGDVHAAIVDLAAPQATLPRLVTVQAPYMMTNGTTATVGVLFQNGGADTFVTRLRLVVPGGYDLLNNHGKGVPLFNESFDASVVPLAPGSGAWHRVSSTIVEWSCPSCPNGGVEVTPDAAQEFMLNLTVDPSAQTASEMTSDMAYRSNVSYPATGYHSDAYLDASSPGIIRSSAPAKTSTNAHGYPTVGNGGNALGANAITETPVNGSIHMAPTSASFGLGPTGFTSLASFRSALYNSSFNTSRHAVPIGGTTELTLDARSLATLLSQDGVTVFWANFSTYPPPSMGKYPSTRASFDVHNGPPPSISHVLAFDPTGASSPTCTRRCRRRTRSTRSPTLQAPLRGRRAFPTRSTRSRATRNSRRASSSSRTAAARSARPSP
ncbi:MAG: hypothetical protein ACYDCK_02835 [Thermoplasmatota archaeon]